MTILRILIATIVTCWFMRNHGLLEHILGFVIAYIVLGIGLS